MDAAQAESLLAQYQMPAGLLLLIPTVIVIILAVRGVNIFASLGVGILAAIIIGLGAGPVSYTHLDVYKRQP